MKRISEMKNANTRFVSGENFFSHEQTVSFSEFDNEGVIVFPGFCDVHVHFREPGFSYKETIATGSIAAARGGYTDVCTMPNLKPVPDSAENLGKQLEIIERDACIHVYPYASITENQAGEKLSAMSEMAGNAIAFTDDGRGVQSDELMEKAMEEARSLGRMIVAHCEVNSLLRGGYIHDGEYARAHGHKGICSESEWMQIERDIALAKKTGCAYHVCHISAKESVDIIRRAKLDGVNVTCETAPHYLVLDDSYLQENGKFKMNPPLRSRENRESLVEGLIDGTIDCIATDHAPHSAEEKSRGLEKSLFGITGIETAFPVLYTYLVKEGIVPLETIVSALTENPRRRFGIPLGNSFTLFDLGKEYKINTDDFLSLGKATPFEGMSVYGKNLLTVCDGRIVYKP